MLPVVTSCKGANTGLIESTTHMIHIMTPYLHLITKEFGRYSNKIKRISSYSLHLLEDSDKNFKFKLFNHYLRDLNNLNFMINNFDP